MSIPFYDAVNCLNQQKKMTNIRLLGGALAPNC